MNWLPLIFNWLWATPKTTASHDVTYEAPIHGLRGLLYTLAPESPQATPYQDDRLRNIAHHLQIEQIMSQHWPSDIAAPVVMKGFDYTLNLYPEIGLRRANDIDLLISPQYFDEVCDTLARFMDIRNAPNENRFDHEAPSAVTFEFEDVTIDLHHTPIMNHQTRLNTDSIIAASQLGKIGQCDVLYPSPDDRLLLWLHNFSKNFQPINMHQLIDLALILKSLKLGTTKADWNPVFIEVHKHGLFSAFKLALSYLNASGIWFEPIELDRSVEQSRRYDTWIRSKTNPSTTFNVLKGLLLIRRTIPEGRVAVAQRLLSKL